MEARLVEFGELLRHNGIRVSPQELTDAARAVELIGLEDREGFHSVLRTCLLKRGADAPVFDRLFALYFTGAAKMLDDIDRALLKAIEDEGLLEDDQLQMIAMTLSQVVEGMSPLAQAVLSGDRARLARLFRSAALRIDFSRLESPLQQGFFSRRLLSAAGAEQGQRDLDEVQRELLARGLDTEGLELVSRHVAGAMRKVEDAARSFVAREAKARVKRPVAGGLAERPFTNLSREELEKAALAVRRLAERLKSRLVRRQKSRRKGTLNVRRTLRRNLTWGGIPARLAFRTRRPQRPDVVVLCDVSDSVRNVSQMMLLFVHTLQSLFTRVRTFVFVSDIGEVTEHLRGVDARQAVDLSVAGKAINVYANSNYGRALASFARDHLGVVTRRTTVLVIGDGRNNYNEANAWALGDIKRKAKRLIWICPEERRGWGLGDSEMLSYAKHCERVAVVQNLADLTEVADELVPRS